MKSNITKIFALSIVTLISASVSAEAKAANWWEPKVSLKYGKDFECTSVRNKAGKWVARGKFNLGTVDIRAVNGVVKKDKGSANKEIVIQSAKPSKWAADMLCSNIRELVAKSAQLKKGKSDREGRNYEDYAIFTKYEATDLKVLSNKGVFISARIDDVELEHGAHYRQVCQKDANGNPTSCSNERTYETLSITDRDFGYTFSAY